MKSEVVESNTNEIIVEKKVVKSPSKGKSSNGSKNGNSNNEKKWGLSFLFNLLSGKKNLPAPKKRNNLVFRKISKAQQRDLPSTTWISLIQLGLWDNTTGPRVEVIWKGTEAVPEDVQQYALKITIIADLAQKSTSNHVETKFHLYSELGYVIIATSFATIYEDTPTKFSLNLIVRKECLDRYLILHKVIEDRMKRSAKIMQKLIQKKLPVVDTFSKYIPNFEINLDALYHASLPSSINFPSTFFYGNNYDSEFLSRVITSHLQTHGYSIVIGKDEKDINMFIESLSVFLEPKDRSRCSFVVEGRGFIPDLLIQGISDESLFKIEDVVQTMMPSSIINLNKRTVTKTCAYHEFIIHRKNFLRTEKKNALNSDTTEPKVNWAPGESFFDNVKSSNTSVFANNLLKQTFELPFSLRAGFVSQQYRMLKKRAVALISFVEYETKQNDILEAQRLMEIKQDIGCENSESDFTILLAIAEKLKPGMYQCVAGNLFRRIYDLFNNF